MCLCISSERYVLKELGGAYGAWIKSLINIRRGSCVKGSLKNIHGGWKKSLMHLKLKGYMKGPLKMNRAP